MLTFIQANYLELKPPSSVTLYRYSIVITPEAPPRKAFRIIELLLSEGRVSALGPAVTSDMRSNLVSAQPLDKDMLRDKITYRGDLEDDPALSPKTPNDYTITLDQIGVFSLGQMIDYLTSSNASQMFDAKDDYTQALNIVLGFKSKINPDVLSIGANRH